MKPMDILENIVGSEDLCEVCGEAPVTLRVQGETDSFGHEDIFMCQKCYEHMLDSRESEEAEIVANGEIAPEGLVWLFIASAADDYDWACRWSTNRGKCEVAELRAEERFASHGGCYGAEIKLVPEAEAKAVSQRYQHRWDDEYEEDLYEEEEEEEEPWMSDEELNCCPDYEEEVEAGK